jgi:hypothetical protein
VDAEASPYKSAHGRPFHGIIAFSKTPFLVDPTTQSAAGLDICCVTIQSDIGPVTCCGVYHAPQAPLTASLQIVMQTVHEQLADCKTKGVAVDNVLVLGDFNVDFKHGTTSSKQTVMHSFMQAHNFNLVSLTTMPTHDDGSHTDSIWWSAKDEDIKLESGISPSYWSDHCSIWAQLYPAAC